jgi:hypothetical protein
MTRSFPLVRHPRIVLVLVLIAALVGNASTGEVLSSPKTDTHVDGIYSLPWGTIAAFHSLAGQGHVLLEKGILRWSPYIMAWRPKQQPAPGQRVVYDLETVARYQARDVMWAQLLMGRAVDDVVHGVRVTFDDGFIQEAATVDQHFIVFSAEHGAACTLAVLDADGTVLQQERLQAFRPHLSDPLDFDCKP